MYRAGGPSATAAALPWSRKGIAPWTTAVTAAAALAVALPQVMLASLVSWKSVSGLGAGQVLLAVESVAIPLVVATAGAMLLRGRRVLLGPLLALALFPFATALAVTVRPLYLAARGDQQISHFAVNVFGETEVTVLYGACASAAACVVLAVAMAGAVGTVDRDRLDVLPRSPWSVLSVGSLWFLLAFAVRATTASAFGNAAFLALSLVAPLAATALAAWLTWCSGVFARSDDAKERRATFAMVVIGALASGAAVLLFDRASSAAATYETMRALDAGEGEPFALLLALSSARSLQSFALAVDIAGWAIVFGIPVRSTWAAVPTVDRRRDMLRSRSLLAAGASTLLGWLLVVIVSLVGSASRSVAARSAEAATIAPGDLELPTVRAEVRRAWFLRGESLTLHVDGTIGKLDTSGNATVVNVYADRRAPFSMLANAVQTSRFPTHFYLVSRREIPLTGPNGREALGDLGALLPPPDHATPVKVLVRPSSPGTLVVRLDEAPAARLQWQGRERIVSLGGAEDAVARSAAFAEIVGADADASRCPIRVLPRGSDTIERVLGVLQSLGGRDVELGVERPTSSVRGPGGSASSPRGR